MMKVFIKCMNSCNIGRKGHGHGYWVDEMGKNPIVI
jgi:hypothetical protein